MDGILIVDDSRTVCAQLAEWLTDMGFNTRSVLSGAACLESVRADPPDLIILDLGLPDIDGFEVCSKLRESEDTVRIPIIVLTSSDADEDRIRSLEMGAEDFLIKPPTLPALRARIRSLLRAKHLSDRLLISYLELDRLGRFAESFLERSISDWSRPDVANAMAAQVLAVEKGDRNRPQWIWGGTITGENVLGLTWTRIGDRTSSEMTRFSRDDLYPLIESFAKGADHFISKMPMSRELADLLAMSRPEPPPNFVAVQAEHRIVLAAGYPWEVGSYEVPLLRAMHRHWLVFERLRADAARIEDAFFKTMDALALAAEFYDTGTGVHIRRVGILSGRMAGLAGQDGPYVKAITQAAKVHDVGKITIPLRILSKPSRLSDEEMEIMKRHTTNGAQVLGDSPHLSLARQISLHHHENFDGSGYPNKLAGEDIPLEARIVRLMDVYDALRSKRHYKASITHGNSIKILTEGDHRVLPGNFDPDLLDLLISNGPELSEMYDALGEAEE